MKLLSRLVVGLLVCLMAIPLLAVPVQAQGDGDDPGIVLYPASGCPGEEIRVYGTNFEPEKEVRIYFYTDSTHRERVETDIADGDKKFSVRFVVPESTKGDHRVNATNAEWGDSASAYFTVEPGLEISPEEGAVGTEVKVTGTGFEEDEEDIEIRYYLDSSEYEKVADDITADENGSWETTFNVPTSSKGDHKIDAKGDDSSLSEVEGATFEVKPGISLSKTSGYVGDTVTVKGSGFKNEESGVKVTYDGTQVGESITADESGTWEISLEIPPSVKGSHKIDAYGSSTSATTISNKAFAVKSKMALTPTSGSVGTGLSVSGTGFAASKRVTITYDGATVGTGDTDSKGSFPGVSFEATHTQSAHTANHPVVATDAVGNSEKASFVMESTPPAKPKLKSPEDGARLGFIGKQAATFEWEEVTDDSGVSYKLQIASDKDFVSLVVPGIGSLTEASYTLPEEQALPYGSYYWRVKVVDGAMNDSGWTGSYSFKSGILPLWAGIAIIALIVVLIGVLVYVFGVRRRGYYDL
jgi:IPT/TIG domain.